MVRDRVSNSRKSLRHSLHFRGPAASLIRDGAAAHPPPPGRQPRRATFLATALIFHGAVEVVPFCILRFINHHRSRTEQRSPNHAFTFLRCCFFRFSRCLFFGLPYPRFIAARTRNRPKSRFVPKLQLHLRSRRTLAASILDRPAPRFSSFRHPLVTHRASRPADGNPRSERVLTRPRPLANKARHRLTTLHPAPHGVQLQSESPLDLLERIWLRHAARQSAFRSGLHPDPPQCPPHQLLQRSTAPARVQHKPRGEHMGDRERDRPGRAVWRHRRYGVGEEGVGARSPQGRRRMHRLGVSIAKRRSL